MKRRSTLSNYWPEPKQKENKDKRSASSNPELEEPQSGTAVSKSSEVTLFLSEEDSICESESCTVAEQSDTTVSLSTAPMRLKPAYFPVKNQKQHRTLYLM